MAKKTVTPTTLDPIQFSEKYSKAHITGICTRCNTTYEYWKRIRDRRIRPSVDLARALVKESGGELSIDTLLFEKEQRRGVGAPPIRSTAAVNATPQI